MTATTIFEVLMRLRLLCAVLALSAVAGSASAQQRPLVTEDPEPIGAGRVLSKAASTSRDDQQYPVSGLEGNCWRVPTIGVSIGLSSIAELQIDGGFYDRLNINDPRPDAPLASELTATGDSTHDVVGLRRSRTKIRLLAEAAGRPALGIRFATKLPNASNESGLGLDTTDFYVSLLGAKTVQSIRVVGNLASASWPTRRTGHRQNDVLAYGVSFARAMTQAAEIVGELNGRVSTRGGDPFPGTENRGLLKLGGRYTRGPVRLDAGCSSG